MNLSDLGPRICIIGPSNSGKSTLANAISRRHGLPAVHLDQLYHLPGTDWRPRPPGEFDQHHNAAIGKPAWVMDGNYSRLLPARLERATGLIRLDVSVPHRLWRYLRRTLFETARIGGLEGDRDSLKWAMFKYVALDARRIRRQHTAIFASFGKPKTALLSRRAIAEACRHWDL